MNGSEFAAKLGGKVSREREEMCEREKYTLKMIFHSLERARARGE